MNPEIHPQPEDNINSNFTLQQRVQYLENIIQQLRHEINALRLEIRALNRQNRFPSFIGDPYL